ncbi:hypothetical protein [Gottfriedia solisilvae]|uniref:Pentapeptide repeat-containing protein n=1 Tax=Gottfriedia solisilvae TaxID=1516104 RepID=A0A8J3APX9_9BACI|nr:hypothetical protein [Gottfriedia solisilvae]GGI17785.1 hypothetical protein GCM10007380_39670 [Gottfriedia solisilvae]
MEFLSEEILFALIDKELPIFDKKFKTIDFRKNGFSNEERILNRIIFENCRFDYLDLGFVTFENSLTFKHCVIKNGFFHSVHFKGDLIIENCIFEKETDFSCGEIYSSFTLLKTTFNQYVDFFDTFFNG